MTRSVWRASVIAAVVVTAGAACGGTAGPNPPAVSPQAAAPSSSGAQANRNRRPVGAADVRFMTSMIPHHAQAVLFSGWAASHGAGRAVRVLCERIVVAQTDEIATMRTWLEDLGEPVPAADATHAGMMMDGMRHEMTMPGMLTDEQLAELDAARDFEFDRLFLTFMIQHHEGALTMVDDLFTSYGGAQDDMVFKLASDIYADQSTEIERMRSMLDARFPGGDGP